MAQWSARRTRIQAVPGSSPALATCWIFSWLYRVQILSQMVASCQLRVFNPVVLDLSYLFPSFQWIVCKPGNVRISSPNDLREVHCPYLTRGSAQHPFHFQRYSSTINVHKYSFFVRTVPAWNPLSPVSVCADSVAVFHSKYL